MVFFNEALEDYEAGMEIKMQPVLKRYKSDYDHWKYERDGVLAAIKEAKRRGQSTEQKKAELIELDEQEPISPKIPEILLGDETPENLAWRLAKKWPSAGIVSNEAGSVLGSHGMGKDSIMRNLALYNKLWDGGTHSIGRRTSESFTVRGTRLTTSLQVQSATLQEFYERSGSLARGTGYFSRFLIAWPESTQGGRIAKEPPTDTPMLTAFHDRILGILSEPAPVDENGCLKPAMLKFDEDTYEAWKVFHDYVERKLAEGGDFRDIRDIAGKAADNAARLAALFHVFAHGTDGLIGVDSFRSASEIVNWHLYEAKRFFGELSTPTQKATKIQKLDKFLVEYCQSRGINAVAKSDAMHLSPIRDATSLDAAIDQLVELGRMKIEIRDKRTVFVINPKLLM